MKSTIIISLLLATISYGQYFTKEKIIYLTSTTAFSFTSGWTEGLQQKEIYYTTCQDEKRDLNELWHHTQTGERALGFVTGAAIAMDSELKPLHIVSDMLLTASLHWLIYDGMENTLRGKPWFWTSGQSTAVTDRFAKPLYKVGMVVVSFLLNYLLFN